MRRLVLAVCLGMLIFASACRDQVDSPTEPVSSPEESQARGCKPVPFPLVQVSSLINQIFPVGKLRIEAVARVGAIAVLWKSCRVSAAQKAAVDFVTWMNSKSASLTGTQQQRSTLINLILNGVGVPVTVPTDSPGDFGVGFFDPASTTNTLVETQNRTALVDLEPGSFNEPTTIVVSRRSDNFRLTNFAGNQFPPFFDYDAINASGDHVLKNGKTAIVAFCLLDPVYTYPENRRIGHNPVAGAPGFPFEILPPVDLAEDRPDLAEALNCENLDPNTVIIGGFGKGLPGLATAAWRTARYYVEPVAKGLFLPEALYAATLGTLPPPGGRASSLSPFGIVEPTETSDLGLGQGWSVNNAGKVAGYSRDPEGAGRRATVWVNGVSTLLLDVQGSSGFSSEARDVNTSGQVAGYINSRAYLWSAEATPTELPLPEGAASSFATALNDQAVVVGGTTISGQLRAVRWQNGESTVLGTLNGGDSFANEVNGSGVIVGNSNGHAVRWQDGTLTDLGTLGGLSSSANGINTSGQIVGQSTTSSGHQHAFLWQNGTMTDLGTLGTGQESVAMDINDDGEVVGATAITPTPCCEGGDPIVHAFVWRNGTMFDLGPPDADEGQAFGISNTGFVAGNSVDFDGFSHAILWKLR
jgi:probable HAF family extracellular repeat protein